MINVIGIGCENKQLLPQTISPVTIQHHKTKHFLQGTTMAWQMLSQCTCTSAVFKCMWMASMKCMHKSSEVMSTVFFQVKMQQINAKNCACASK